MVVGLRRNIFFWHCQQCKKYLLFPEKPSDTIRLTLAKYDKREESEHLVTNIFAHRKEDKFEEVLKMHVPEKASESAQFQAAPSKPVETVQPTEEAVPIPIQVVEESPIPPPRKHPPKEKEEVPIAVETPVGASTKEEEVCSGS